MPKKEIKVNPDELDYGSDFIGENSTNPLFTNVFNQPANVNTAEMEYMVIPRYKLHSFPNHPYKVSVDEDMMDLRDSIIDNGILQPLIVRARNDGDYEIISGHRRSKAAELAKLSDVPVIIMKNLSDVQATIMMVDSNKQREIILPSERAFAYKMKMDAMNRQGKQLVEPGSTSVKSRDVIAEQDRITGRQLSKYIRLTHLIPQLLDLVDNDALKQSPSMAIKPAVEISYLKENEQKFFYDTVKALGKTPSVQQAAQIKNLSKNGLLTQTDVMNILIMDKPNQRETVKVDYEKLGGYFNERLSPRECEKKVFDSLESLNKIRASVDKHINGKITDEELATLIDNLLNQYGKSKSRNVQSQVR